MRHCSKPLELVFVHLGSARPLHLKPNIIRLKSLFPEVQINLIVDQFSLKNFKDLENVNIYNYEPDSAVEELFNFSKNNLDFRNGFWRYSLERIFAITDLHRNIPDVKLLHLESDVLILPNFPFLKFESIDTLAWCKFNETKDVASLLFTPTFTESRWLTEIIKNEMELNASITDMKALSLISKKYSEKIKILPSLPNKNKSKLINHNSKNLLGDISFLSDNFDEFDGIFDSAPIGMWLLGQDPRNHFGKLILHDDSFISSGDSFVNPSRVVYDMNENGHIFIKDESLKYPLYCLHVHSKEQKIFSKIWITIISDYIKLASNEKQIKYIKIEIVLQIYFELVRSRSVIRYILIQPYIYKKIKKLRSKLKKITSILSDCLI
jgi:hypothetical protein